MLARHAAKTRRPISGLAQNAAEVWSTIHAAGSWPDDPAVLLATADDPMTLTSLGFAAPLTGFYRTVG